MKRFLPLLLALVFCSVLIGSPVVQAKPVAPSHPLSYTCTSGNCYAYNQWYGTQSGGWYDTSAASSPNTAEYGGCWQRTLDVFFNSWNQYSIYAGLYKSNTSSCGFSPHVCPNNGSTYAFVVGYNGNFQQSGIVCTILYSQDINADTYFKVWYDDFANVWTAEVYLTSSGREALNTFPTSVMGYSTSAQYIRNTEQFDDIIDTNKHYVYGVDNSQNYWLRSSDFTWQPQTVSGTHGGATGSTPPQMYWNQAPAPGNNGGHEYVCIYDPPAYVANGNKCTLGG